MTAQQAIEQSIREGRSSCLDWTQEIETDLLAECEEWAVTDGDVSYWGTTEDGGEWTVHVRGLAHG